MKFTKEVVSMLKTFILESVESHPNDLTKFTCAHFKFSPPTVLKYIYELIQEGVLEKRGSNRFPKYALTKKHYSWSFENIKLEEHIVWKNTAMPLLGNLPVNVREICDYGFNEMVNNAIDHSEGNSIRIELITDYMTVKFKIMDDGVGIFEKIKNALNLEHENHAIFELCKGKFTTDPDRHSGEGVFFTSRIFDNFFIFSRKLTFAGFGNQDGYLFEEMDNVEGTVVVMRINKKSHKKLIDIMNEYADYEKNPAFHKTIIPVRLMQHEGEFLMSRSQAKRLIARVDRFLEVILDFEGVKTIGQAFADEVFRVFKNMHPSVHIEPVNTVPDVKNMINRIEASM